MVKVKCGAIIKEINEGALKWYKAAGWKVIEDKKIQKKKEIEVIDDKTNSKKTITP